MARSSRIVRSMKTLISRTASVRRMKVAPATTAASTASGDIDIDSAGRPGQRYSPVMPK